MSRIRITGGPWPERIGCEGIIVRRPDSPEGERYPWAGRARAEVIVLLDDDPLSCDKRGCKHGPDDSLRCLRRSGTPWTCALKLANVELIGGGR